MALKRRIGRAVDKTGRSKGEGQYALLPYVLLNSNAWRSLSGSAVKVFLELRTRFHGVNNGRLILSLDEGARILGLGKSTVQRALDELQERGFVICTRKGNWYGRLASTWTVTDQRTNGAPATNAWKAWRSTPAPAVLEPDQKTERGPVAEPSASFVVPSQDREHHDGAELEPVTPIRLVAIGSGMGR